MEEIRILDINADKFNPFGATNEELLANALDEAGLIKPETMINGIPARNFCQAYFEKRDNYKEATKLGNLLVKNEIISVEQLHSALEYQRTNPDLKIGNILLMLNLCTIEQIESSLSAQTNMREGIKELVTYRNQIVHITEKLKSYFN